MAKVLEYQINRMGITVRVAYDTTGMLVPVVCTHCGKVYDLTATTVIHRYIDATLYQTPCCDKQVDDRERVSLPAFRRLTNLRRRV